MLNKRSIHFTAFGATALAVLALGPYPAQAKTIKLTVVGAPPVIVTTVAVVKKVVIPEINKLLAASGKDLKIEWRQAYGQSLAKFNEVFETVEEGIADIGVLLRNFEEAKLPLEAYTAMMPFGIQDSMTHIEVDAKLRAQIPEMNQTYLKFNQIFLAGAPSASMQLFTTFPVSKYEDLKGRKIGASGNLGHLLRGTGATIVTASMAQSYTDIKNGLYDGYPIHVGLSFPYQTYKAAKYYTETNFGINSIPALSVNKKTWDGFPAFLREIFKKATAKYPIAYAKMDDAKIKKFSGIMKKKGVKFSKLSDAERKRWAKTMPNLASEWIARLEPKGLPVRKLVKAYMDEVRRVNPNVIRHWDR